MRFHYLIALGLDAAAIAYFALVWHKTTSSPVHDLAFGLILFAGALAFGFMGKIWGPRNDD